MPSKNATPTSFLGPDRQASCQPACLSPEAFPPQPIAAVCFQPGLIMVLISHGPHEQGRARRKCFSKALAYRARSLAVPSKCVPSIGISEQRSLECLAQNAIRSWQTHPGGMPVCLGTISEESSKFILLILSAHPPMSPRHTREGSQSRESNRSMNLPPPFYWPKPYPTATRMAARSPLS